MNDVVAVGNAKYDRYKELLLRKDALRKESFQYEIDYVREFGDLINECFEAKILCIEKKKIIAYVQKIINKGDKPNQADIDNFIEETMKDYYAQLKQMLEQNKAAKDSTRISAFTLKKIKNVYYRIAKLIHPDMNPALKDDKTIQDLWNRCVIAYECNNLKDIEEIEVLVNQYLESIDYKGNIVDIPDIDEKIFKLNEEIDDIINNDPYQYKYLLMDIDAVNEKKNNIKIETEDYNNYAKQLDEVINKFSIERIMA